MFSSTILITKDDVLLDSSLLEPWINQTLEDANLPNSEGISQARKVFGILPEYNLPEFKKYHNSKKDTSKFRKSKSLSTKTILSRLFKRATPKETRILKDAGITPDSADALIQLLAGHK